VAHAPKFSESQQQEALEHSRLERELAQTEQQQVQLMAHIQQRALEGRVRLTAYDDQLDTLEAKREAIASELALLPNEQQATEHLNKLNAQHVDFHAEVSRVFHREVSHL
jgi:chromosome segregation ATPase